MKEKTEDKGQGTDWSITSSHQKTGCPTSGNETHSQKTLRESARNHRPNKGSCDSWGSVPEIRGTYRMWEEDYRSTFALGRETQGWQGHRLCGGVFWGVIQAGRTDLIQFVRSFSAISGAVFGGWGLSDFPHALGAIGNKQDFKQKQQNGMVKV